MKVWIVGAQGTYKKRVTKLLEEDGFTTGKLFTNMSPSENIYHKDLYNFYSSDDVKEIFENNAYIFINNIFDKKLNIFEGMDLNEYENANVITLSIDKFLYVNTRYVAKDDIIVWLDGDKTWRFNNIIEPHDIAAQEKAEKTQYVDFYKALENFSSMYKNVLYFFDECPERVKTIIKVIYNNPKLKSELIKNFSI